MSSYQFGAEPIALEYIDCIVEALVKLFGISNDEAVGRVNRKWKGLTFADDDLELFRESVSWWAHNVYYGHDSGWWHGTGNLSPLPYSDQA